MLLRARLLFLCACISFFLAGVCFFLLSHVFCLPFVKSLLFSSLLFIWLFVGRSFAIHIILNLFCASRIFAPNNNTPNRKINMTNEVEREQKTIRQEIVRIQIVRGNEIPSQLYDWTKTSLANFAQESLATANKNTT